MADITPPKIAITSNKTAIKAGETALITFALSEAATDFLLSDITVTGGTLSNFAGTGMSYSATFTPNSNSTSQGSVSVGNFKFSDAAGNANEDGAEANNRLTLTIDTIAPTIRISSDRTFLASNETPTVYFLLSEPSSNFDISDISVTGGSVSSFKGSGSSYSVVVTPDGTSNCFVSVLAYRFTDAVGNANYGNSSVTSIYNSGAISAATTLVPYDPRNAQVVWTREFGTSGTDVAQALTTSADGSIYVTGYMSGQTSSNRTDAFLTKFTADGEKVWSRILINADFSSYEVALALTTGSDGNVYVGGRIGGYDGNGQNNPAFISKYSPDGTKIWTTLVGSEIFDISRVAIAYGLDGSVYISGSTMRSFDGQTNNGYYDAFVTKLSPDGTKVWTRILGLIGLDYSNALTTGLDGSVYISGRTNGSLDGQPYSGSNDSYGGDAFITKLTPDGTKVWTRLVGTSEGETGFSLATGLDGSIYLCGYTWGSLDGKTPYGTFITKYSPDGTKAWTQMLFTRGGGFVQDSFNSISVGNDGGIYVSGTTGFSLDGQELISGQDAFLTKYNPDGTKEWTRMLGGMGLDAGTGVKVGSDGAIYLTGFTSGSIDGQTNNGGTDSFIIKLASPDTSVPQISVSTNKTTLSVGESASILITLSKPSTNFIQSDITTQGGILSNFQGSGTSYSAVFTPSIEGVNGALVSVSSGKFSDVLGIFNEDGADANNKVSFKVTVPADTTPPTIAVTSNSTSLAASQSTSILFALSKLSTNFSADDVIVAGGTLSNFTGSGATYSALFTPTANSTTKGTISVPSGVFTDAAGNANTDGADNNNSFTFVVDTVIPSIALSTSKNRLIAGELATLSFVLSEASASFTASDVTVTGGTISNFAGSGTTYTATFTLAANSTASGLVSVASGVFTDYAGNANADGSDVNNSITFVINNAPIANAGPQQYVQVGAAVTLNGANSSDPNGDQLSYRWSTVLKPINSASVLTNQASAQPVFVADLVGTYIFSLVVNDGRLDSATSFITVEVSIPNAPPIANAGSNQNVVIGPVTLDGSASSDADGDTLTYKWFLVAKPNNSTATLVSPTAQKPTINTDIAGVYVFTLIVSDGKLDSSPVTTSITVNALPAPDITPPTIRIFAETAGLIAGQTKTITFYLSEPSSNFVASDVNATGGTLSNWVGYGNTYTALFTPSANTTANGVISVLSSVFTDAAGNANADGSDANNSVVFSIDTVVPTISLSTNKSSLNSGETAIVNFTISEPSINFTFSDVTVIGGTLSNFSGSGTAYSATFTPAVNSSINGVVSVSSGVFTDLAGNTNLDGFDSNNAVSIAQVVKDLAPPSPISFSPSLGETNVDVSRNIVITFNEKIQRGAGVIDIRLGHPKLGNLLESFNVATSDRLTYDGTTLTINPTRDLKGNYYLFIYLADGAVQDSAGNKSANISYYTISTANQITTEYYSLSVVVNKGVLGAEPVLLKGLTESIVFENGYTKKHIVEYAGSTFDYNQIDSLIMTVTRDGEFTEEFTREINDYVKTELNISYSAAVAIVGATTIDDVILTVAGSDGNYVG